jgi:DNA repair exonuclease SbcCD nuclease subunit
MIKRIVHIADLHIKTFQLHDLYRKQFQELINQLEIELLGQSKEEIRIVIAGDIFHQKINISNEQLILTSWFLSELSKLGKVVMIPGNHDFLENNTQRLDSITPVVELLNNQDIVYYRDSGLYVDDNIKWVVYSLFQHNQRPEFEKEDGLYIGLFHGPIQGFSTDLGFTFDDAYDRSNFYGCDIVLCGDIHKRAIVNLEIESVKKIPIIQIGSLIQQNFGETVKHHGYGIYDVNTNEYTFHDLPNEEPFLHFTINDITDIENEKELHVNLG